MTSTARPLAALGLAGALAVGAVAGLGVGPADAATSAGLTTHCTLTVRHPANVYKGYRGEGLIGISKHTGDKVTSEDSYRLYRYGFDAYHEVNLASGGRGYMLAYDLGPVTPVPATVDYYTVTVDRATVRNAPYGTTWSSSPIVLKARGQRMATGWSKGEGQLDGFDQVLLANGSIGWVDDHEVS